MRKKILGICLAATMAAMLCSCGSKDNTVSMSTEADTTTEQASTEEVTEATEETTEEAEETTESTAEVQVDLESTIRALIEENTYCMMDVFMLNNLPIKGEPQDGVYVYEVDDAKFPTYQAFEDYIKSVYVNTEAVRLLNDYPQEAEPLYIDVDGKLYIDTLKSGGVGYYVSWDDYTVEIKASTDTTCNFVIHTVITEPGDEPVEEAYDVEGSMTLENGVWLLDKMLY